MAIRTGGDNRKGARAGQAAGDGRTSLRLNGKDVPQFAPNFSVYVLPPDAVCLYSEDRKFFLHGELYCALAAAIGKGGKTFQQLVRALERTFPVDKIEEALTRLVERRYVVTSLHGLPAVAAGSLMSLGLPAEIAAKNLQGCRVRVEGRSTCRARPS